MHRWYHLRWVALHEFGHWIELGHSSQVSLSDVMSASVEPCWNVTSTDAHNRADLRAIYGP
jgi:hypothetical protein